MWTVRGSNPPAGRLFDPGVRIFSDRGTTMGKKKSDKYDTIFLVCKETGDRNYTIRKKPRSTKLEIKKYCPRLRKHTVHTEKKK